MKLGQRLPKDKPGKLKNYGFYMLSENERRIQRKRKGASSQMGAIDKQTEKIKIHIGRLSSADCQAHEEFEPDKYKKGSKDLDTKSATSPVERPKTELERYQEK